MARVLIVEDEWTDRIILGNIVKRTGHEVYFASDGEQAVKIYARKSIEVVVTDLHMPHVDGPELIMSLRALLPETPIIVVSGKGPEVLAEACGTGVVVVLSKPVDPHELLEAIAKTTPRGSAAPARTGIG